MQKTTFYIICIVVLLKTEVKQRHSKNLQSKEFVLTTPFIQDKLVTQRGDILHTIDRPMQLIHNDVADLLFFSKLAVAPK